MKEVHIYVDENHDVRAFNGESEDAQNFIEFGGGVHIVLHNYNGPIIVEGNHVQIEEGDE